MTGKGKELLNHVLLDRGLSRDAVIGYATKARATYGDEEAARALEEEAKGRKPQAEPFFCYECGGALCEHTPLGPSDDTPPEPMRVERSRKVRHR